MIIGNGQLADIFKGFQISDCLIFASGVSNSNCTDEKEFKREEELLLKNLKEHKDKKFVYFSSCALSVEEYEKNDYYQHKQNMENMIKKYSSNYYIFRVPQLFGTLKTHNTLINFIYFSIIENRKFKLYNEAYRYVIEINDIKLLVEKYLLYSNSCITIDLANPHRYKVLDIVKTFEILLDKKANYDLIDKDDGYILNLRELEKFINKNNLNINFSKNYLKIKLEEKLMENNKI